MTKGKGAARDRGAGSTEASRRAAKAKLEQKVGKGRTDNQVWRKDPATGQGRWEKR